MTAYGHVFLLLPAPLHSTNAWPCLTLITYTRAQACCIHTPAQPARVGAAQLCIYAPPAASHDLANEQTAVDDGRCNPDLQRVPAYAAA